MGDLNLNGFLNSTSTQLILAIIGILEFLVSVISFLKISRVRKSQVEYRDIIELDSILKNIATNNEMLSRIKAECSERLSAESIKHIDAVLADNNRCIGAVKKANQILLDKNIKRQSYSNENAIYHETGYFTKEFFDQIILSSKKRIVLYIKRNTRPFMLDNLEALLRLAEKGVSIDIFAFSPTINSIILNEMRDSIPNCPSNDELISSQQFNKEMYVNKKKRIKQKENIHYYEYCDYPLSQYIIVDEKLYWGIVNFDKSKMENPFVYRPYIEMDISNYFSKYIVSLYNDEKTKCINNKACF